MFDTCSGIIRFVVRQRNIRNRFLFYTASTETRHIKRSRMFANSAFETA